MYLSCRSEVLEVWKAVSIKAVNVSIYFGSTRFLSTVVFLAAWQLGSSLTTSVIFSTVAWIESLKLTVFLFLVFAAETNTTLWASLKRIQVHLFRSKIWYISYTTGGIVHFVTVVNRILAFEGLCALTNWELHLILTSSVMWWMLILSSCHD